MSLSPEDFRELFEQDFPPPSDYLAGLADEYHRRTDEYDRTVCTGPVGRDGILPANGRELALIGNHAVGVWRELMRRALDHGFTSREFHRAIVRR